MDNEDWKILKVLYNSKSLSDASQKLYITQPALTRRIQGLEKEFRITIITRSSKGIQFTPKGVQLARYAIDMSSRYEDMRQHIIGNQSAGRIRIASSSSQAQFFLPDLLHEYLQIQPDVEFELESMFSSECIRQLQNGLVDVAFYRGEYHGRMIQKKLMVHEAYAAYAKPFQLQDLPHLPYVSVDADHTGMGIRESWWYDVFDVAPQLSLSVRNVNICYEMVRHGIGFGIFLNRDLFKENDHLYTMKLSYKNGEPVVRTDYMGYMKGQEETEPLKSFSTFVQNYTQNKYRLNL